MSTKQTQQQYREVSRKANVGERIRIVNAQDGRYKNGEEFAVEFVNKLDDVFVKHPRGTLDGCALILESEYVVLEPVEPVESANFPELLALFIRENAAAVRKYLDEVAPALAIDSDGTTRATGAIVTKPLSRAEVIAKARADVAELMRIGHDDDSWLPERSSYFYGRWFDVNFVVNREKRAVTALVYELDGLGGNYRRKNRKPDAKATAKAAPDDVFHAEIGKAISLRRALGLSVPDEYINAPKPDKPRVGAVVYWHSTFYGKDVRTTLIRRVPKYDGTRFGNFAFCHTAEIGWLADNQYTVIDDTDVDYGTDERSAAA